MSPASEAAPVIPAAQELGGRLHPAVLVIWPFSQIVPLAILLLTDTVAAAFAGVALALAIASGVVRYLRFSWRLAEGILVIEQGLVSRRRRVIPIERIQSVDLVRRVRHRIFGVVEVRIEAVGGSDTEGKLDALSVADAERLRAALLAARRTARPARPGDAAATVDTATVAYPEAPGDAAEGEQLVAMRPAQLVLAGLTGGRVGVAVALLGAAQQLLGERLGRLFTDLPQRFSPAALVGLGAGLLLASFVLSVIVTTVAYWEFRLVRDDDELRVSRGLLEQRLDTIPLRRVQALRIEQNLLRRPLSLAAVKVDVAGKAGGDDTRSAGLLLPLGTLNQAQTLVGALLATPTVADVTLRPMPRAALRRRLSRAAVVTVAPTAVAGGFLGPPGLLALLIAVPAVLGARSAYQALGEGEAGGVLVTRSGLLVRRTAYVPVGNLQSLALTASPFQRRAGLATVELQIPRSPGVWGGPQLLDVERDRAETVLRRLAAELVRGVRRSDELHLT